MFIYSHRSPGCTCQLPLPQRVLGLNVMGKALISRLYFGVHWAEIKPQAEWQSMLSVRCGFTGSTKTPAPRCTSQHIWKEVKLHHWNFLLSLKDLLSVVLHCFSNLFLSHTKFLCVIAWKRSYKSYFQTLIFFLLIFKMREISVFFWKKILCILSGGGMMPWFENTFLLHQSVFIFFLFFNEVLTC